MSQQMLLAKKERETLDRQANADRSNFIKAKKEEGNTAFKAGNLEEAYKLYRYNR